MEELREATFTGHTVVDNDNLNFVTFTIRRMMLASFKVISNHCCRSIVTADCSKLRRWYMYSSARLQNRRSKMCQLTMMFALSIWLPLSVGDTTSSLDTGLVTCSNVDPMNQFVLAATDAKLNPIHRIGLRLGDVAPAECAERCVAKGQLCIGFQTRSVGLKCELLAARSSSGTSFVEYWSVKPLSLL